MGCSKWLKVDGHSQVPNWMVFNFRSAIPFAYRSLLFLRFVVVYVKKFSLETSFAFELIAIYFDVEICWIATSLLRNNFHSLIHLTCSTHCLSGSVWYNSSDFSENIFSLSRLEQGKIKLILIFDFRLLALFLLDLSQAIVLDFLVLFGRDIRFLFSLLSLSVLKKRISTCFFYQETVVWVAYI